MCKEKFEEILRTDTRRIFNYLLKILRNREDAEDILQDVFLAFYQKIETVKEKSYLPYIYRSAYNMALNKIKIRNKYHEIYQNVADAENYPVRLPEEKNSDEKELVKFAFSKLKPEEAMLLELQFYQKMSYKDIAAALSLSVSAVDSRLVRAKKKLKKIILQEKKKGFVNRIRGGRND